MNQTGSQSINIDARECRKRSRVSIIAAGATILMFAALWFYQAEQKWYLLLIIPAWVAVLGLLQVKSRVCVAFAARGVQNLGNGEELVGDPAQVRALREIAIGIYVKSLMIALAFTLIVYFSMG